MFREASFTCLDDIEAPFSSESEAGRTQSKEASHQKYKDHGRSWQYTVDW